MFFRRVYSEVISDDDLKVWTRATPLQDVVFTNSRAWNVETELEVFRTGMMGGSWSTETSKVVRGTTGQRLEILRYPNWLLPHTQANRDSDKVQDFFLKKALTAPGVKESLKKWLSVSRTKYVL